MERSLWINEVRPRLLVAGVMAACLLAFGLAARDSVRLSVPAGGDANMHPYVGQLLAWRAGESALVGWVESEIYPACTSLVVWVKTGGESGYVTIGALKGHRRTTWAGYLADVRGRPLRVSTAPQDLSFVCYRIDYSQSDPLVVGGAT